MEPPLLTISGGDDMRITLDVRSPIANLDFFIGLVGLLEHRLRELRQPTPGDIELASWGDGAPERRG